ncbi:MAG: hypothetical protein ABUL58_06425 [Steroidobacter sp.]
MKLARTLCLSVLSLTFAMPVLADCNYPKTPADPPSGATATKEQMIAANKVTKQYSSDVDEYLKCIDDEAVAAVNALGPDHKPEQEEPIKNKLDIKFDAADKTRKQYVEAMNAEIRAYKAAHPQPAQ